MKRKTLKSVIHNFSYSFQALDYRISQYPLLIELCSLYKKHGVNTIEVDILNNTITPEVACTEEIKQLVRDYCDWLPDLCLSQSINSEILKNFYIKVTVGFESATVFKSSKNERILQVETKYEGIDNLGKSIEGSIVENEVVKKQAYESF